MRAVQPRMSVECDPSSPTGQRPGRRLEHGDDLEAVGDVVDAWLDAGAAPSAHPLDPALQDVEEDRDVVGRQIPDDIDLALEEPEVEAGGVEVIDLTKLAARHQAAQLADG